MELMGNTISNTKNRLYDIKADEIMQKKRQVNLKMQLIEMMQNEPHRKGGNE